MRKIIFIFLSIFFLFGLVPFNKENKIREKFRLVKGSAVDRNIRPFKHTNIKSLQYISSEDIRITNNMLRDMEILSYDEYTGKVFNRAFAHSHIVETHTGEPSYLFDKLQEMVLLPYDGGEDGKILALDAAWCTVFFTGENVLSFGINHYGESGSGIHQLHYPQSITCGRDYTNGSTTIYPIYICDHGNKRIIKVNFEAKPPDERSDFDGTSFTVLTSNLCFPYDIAFSKSSYPELISDKIWVSELSGNDSLGAITCIDEINGNIIQRFMGYKSVDTQVEFNLNGANKSKLSVYNYSGFNALVFIDNLRNNLVTCLLDSNGEGTLEKSQNNIDLIVASEVVHFDFEYPLNSVSVQSTSQHNLGWPNVWVTSGPAPPHYSSTSMLHIIKMNESGNLQYLGSTYRPRNTKWDFVYLKNLAIANGYSDIYTIEEWSDTYGIRKYLPFGDIHSETLHNYCSDSTDQLRFTGVFTNDCWLHLTTLRKNIEGNWETVNIKKLNGNTINNSYAIKYQSAGWNQGDIGLYIDLQLDLRIEDYALGDSVRLNIKLYPEWADENNLSGFPYSVVEKTYGAVVKKYCLPKPGGCPFLYVKDENNDYRADNNLSHRMEFTEPATDITDVYKLRINPSISNNNIEISLIENENDFSQFDRVKLYAIDYPEDRKLGVTEDNIIVTYDSASAFNSDSVMYNYSNNITNYVKYHDQYKILTKGHSNDSLYAHFSYIVKSKSNNQIDAPNNRNDNHNGKEIRARSRSRAGNELKGEFIPVAFVTYLQNLSNPVQSIKDTAGFITAASVNANVTSKMFARRELGSEIIVPLFDRNDFIDNVDIKWQSDFLMKYVGAVNLEYDNYKLTEIPLDTAHYITSTIDSIVTSALTEIDGNTGIVNSSALLKIIFDASVLQWNPPPPGTKRAFVIEVTGQYTNGDNRASDKVNGQVPLTYRLSQNYPNPFNPITKINYEIPKTMKVNLVIYDILGREVKRLVNNELKDAGRYTVEFDAANYASGVYFYRIEAGTYVVSKKMVLIK